MSQQGKRQESIRAVTGKALDYNGDWHALFDAAGIPAGSVNGRMLAWINQSLGTSYPDLAGAQAAYAAAQGAQTWGGMGTFSLAVETVWSATDKTAGIVLSNGNLTAGNNVGASQSVNGTVARSTGKYCFESTITLTSGSGSYFLGVRKTAASAAITGIAAGANGVCNRYSNGAATALTAVEVFWTTGLKVMIAVDLDARLFWLKVGAGNWNNSATSNPATGAEGRDFSPLGAGDYYPYFGTGGTTHVCGVNFGAGAFTITAPSGFTAWNGE
jgi:hypothetical protein